MRLDKIDLNLFVVFDAIYRERSVTRVAAQLNLTQPAVSNALSRLRQTFDDPLFIRTPEGMAPTPVADNVVADVRKALELMRQSVGVNARFDPASSEKVFHLGMNDLAEALVLPRLHDTLRQLAPKVSLTSYYVARESATDELKSGLIDLLLDAPVVNAKELQQQPLAALPYVVAMHHKHPLASTTHITLEDYLAGEHLHVSSRRRGRGHVDIALHRLNKQRQVRMRVQNYLVAARITQETELLWTVPEVLAKSLPLHTCALPFEVEPLSWNLYWSRSAEDDPANRWMRVQLEKLVKTIAS
jgi:DNA-binding transcriptional LysR family regulator